MLYFTNFKRYAEKYRPFMKKGYVVLNCSGFCGGDRCSICTYSVFSCLARFRRAPSRCFQSEASTVGAAASGLSASLCVLQEADTPAGPLCACALTLPSEEQVVLRLYNSALLFTGKGCRTVSSVRVLTKTFIPLFNFQDQQPPSPQPLLSHF